MVGGMASRIPAFGERRRRRGTGDAAATAARRGLLVPVAADGSEIRACLRRKWRIEGMDQRIDRRLVDLEPRIDPNRLGPRVALRIDVLLAKLGHDLSLHRFERPDIPGAAAFEPYQVVTEARLYRLADVADVLHVESALRKRGVHPFAREPADLTAIDLGRRVVGQLFRGRDEVGTSDELRPRLGRQRQCLFRRVMLEVEQDLRCADLFGDAKPVLLHEVNLFRLERVLVGLGVEFLAGSLLDPAQLQVRERAIDLEGDAPLQHRIALEPGISRIGRERLHDQQVGQIGAQAPRIAGERVAHFRRQALDVGVVIGTRKLGLCVLGQHLAGGMLRGRRNCRRAQAPSARLQRLPGQRRRQQRGEKMIGRTMEPRVGTVESNRWQQLRYRAAPAVGQACRAEFGAGVIIPQSTKNGPAGSGAVACQIAPVRAWN